MTIQQAIERGDRSALAQTIASRHALPMDLAELAVDNRITIRQAVMQKLSREAAHAPASSGVPRGAVFAMLGLLLLVMGVGIGLWSQKAPTPDGVPGNPIDDGAMPARFSSEPGTRSGPRAVPRTDAAGRIVEISGSDPRSVLIAFCESGPEASFREPMDVVESIPPSPSWRLGLLRSTTEANAPIRAIRIRKDPTTSRWVAGDGQNPIPTEELRRPGAAGASPDSAATPDETLPFAGAGAISGGTGG